MRLCIAVVVILLGLAGVAGAAGLTSNVGKVHGTRSPVLCTEPCRPGDINENEPDCSDGYFDATNGGCNSQGWTDLVANAGQTVAYACGASGTFYYGAYSYRDTDWYRATANAAGAATETVTAEFVPMVVLFYAPSGTISCSNYSYVYAFGAACNAVSITAYLTSAGDEFWPFVATQAVGSGVPCGSRYVLDVTNVVGNGPPAVGACCLPDRSCAYLTERECLDAGGTYLGDRVFCTPEICLATAVQHTTWGSVKSRFP